VDTTVAERPGSSSPQSDAGEDLLRKGADKAIQTGLSGWWESRTETEKAAVVLIGVALAIGPLGQGLLGAVKALFSTALPTSKQLEAVVWLLLITAPLAAFVIVVITMPGKVSNVPVALGVAGIAAVVASYLLSQTPIPDSLSGVYCYAELGGVGVIYEEQCREFNNAGFYAENAPIAGSPSATPQIFSSAVAYTADARGSVMAFASILASVGIAMIIRERS
jgi:hypothetical protein